MTAHSTEEELIAHLYGIGLEDDHVGACAECQARLQAMRSHRQAAELASSPGEVSFEFLAAQRRKIYQKIAEPVRWWSSLQLRRWASAAAGLAVLTGGLLLVENTRRPAAPQSISDAQLARDVSRMAQDSEPPATAPLQALFEE
jgi:hypothetical protein